MNLRLALALLFCLTQGLRADAPAAHLLTVTEKCPEYGIPITRYLWLVGDMRLNFLPPNGWNVQAGADAQQLLIQPDNLQAGFKVNITGVIATNQLPSVNGQPQTLEQYLKQRTLARFPGAQIVEEFSLVANGDPAIIFDLQIVNASGTPVNTRVIYVVAAAHTLQVDLTTTGKLETYRGEMLSLLSSLRFEQPPK